MGVEFSIDVFNREEMKEVAFLYSDYVRDISDDALFTGNTPVTLSEFVEHDLVHYVEQRLYGSNNPNKIYFELKERMEACGVQFNEVEQNGYANDLDVGRE